MGIRCGIVGLPNVGKSTLFNCLTKAGVEASNYPFCTIEPNVGIVPVPDPRLEKLADIVKPERILPTTMEFLDIAGLEAGESKASGFNDLKDQSVSAFLVRIHDAGLIKLMFPIRDSLIEESEKMAAFDAELLTAAIYTNNNTLARYMLDSDRPELSKMGEEEKDLLLVATLGNPEFLFLTKALLGTVGLPYFRENELSSADDEIVTTIINAGNLVALKWLIDEKKINTSLEDMHNYLLTSLSAGQFHIVDWLQKEKKISIPPATLPELVNSLVMTFTSKEPFEKSHILSLLVWLTCGESEDQRIDPQKLKPLIAGEVFHISNHCLIFVNQALDQLSARQAKENTPSLKK